MMREYVTRSSQIVTRRVLSIFGLSSSHSLGGGKMASTSHHEASDILEVRDSSLQYILSIDLFFPRL